MKKSLNGYWQYIIDENDSGEKLGYYFNTTRIFKNSKKMKIPSNWQVAGIDNYCGTVWFKKDFKLSKQDLEDRLILRFNGVDYFAKVWLNGKFLGEHEGYFQPFEFDIKNFAKEQNTLIVKVSSPFEKPGKDGWPHRKKLIKGVFSHHDVRPGSWHPELGQTKGTGGIWNNVELIICKNTIIKNTKISSLLNKDFSQADILVEIDIDSIEKFNKDCFLNIELTDNDNFLVKSERKKILVKKGENKVRLLFKLTNPKLWWPWEIGAQNFYFLKIVLTDLNSNILSVATRRFGIRDIKIDDNKTWFINGKRIFIRGTNIIPEEYLSTYTIKRIKEDVALLREANCNAVRIHAHVNRKELYDALDEAGILVWQDFALQWEYTNDKSFISNAVRQIKDMVNLLHNNPSIVLWCCHNEPVAIAKELDEALYRAVLEEDKTRVVVKSSDFHEHPYPGWFWGHYRYFLSLVGKPFPSEFGAQALPCKETLQKMFSKSDLWPPNWQKWAYHDFAYEQTFHIAQVKMGNSLEEFIQNSQNYQSELIKFAVETYRQNKWSQIKGIFHFMLLEPWPAISYSVVDYFRKKKKGFYTLKKSYQPVIVVCSLQRKIFGLGRKIEGQFWLINDLYKDFENAKIIFSISRKNRCLHKFNSIDINIQKDSCNEITNKVYSYTKGLEIPTRLRTGPAELVVEIFDKDKKLISSNSEEINLVRIPKGIEKFNAEFLWE